MKLRHCLWILCGLLVLTMAGCVVYWLWESGVFITKTTAEVCAEYLTWNGRTYSPAGGPHSEGRVIAKTESGWRIHEVREDPDHHFIVARLGTDNFLYVADDYAIPTDGRLTAVAWDGNYITDAAFLQALTQIDAEKTASFTYQTDAIFAKREDQDMRTLYFAYENCPVATNARGYLGKVQGQWVVTIDISSDTRQENGAPKSYPVSCYVIPSEYWAVLEMYFD